MNSAVNSLGFKNLTVSYFVGRWAVLLCDLGPGRDSLNWFGPLSRPVLGHEFRPEVFGKRQK
jgi:hypothetical protein